MPGFALFYFPDSAPIKHRRGEERSPPAAKSLLERDCEELAVKESARKSGRAQEMMDREGLAALAIARRATSRG